jgi:hypothetical protein
MNSVEIVRTFLHRYRNLLSFRRASNYHTLHNIHSKIFRSGFIYKALEKTVWLLYNIHFTTSYTFNCNLVYPVVKQCMFISLAQHNCHDYSCKLSINIFCNYQVHSGLDTKDKVYTIKILGDILIPRINIDIQYVLASTDKNLHLQ